MKTSFQDYSTLARTQDNTMLYRIMATGVVIGSLTLPHASLQKTIDIDYYKSPSIYTTSFETFLNKPMINSRVSSMDTDSHSTVVASEVYDWKPDTLDDGFLMLG